MSRKCSTHLAVCFCSSGMITPSLFLTGSGDLLLLPDIVLVMSYSLFIIRCPAAFSASVARVLKNAFLSFLALFLTSLLSYQYLKVSLLFLACSVQLLISTFNRFLCVIRFHVSSESHSFWLLLLFPRTSSQDFARCVSVLSSDCLRLPPQIQGLSTYSLLSS